MTEWSHELKKMNYQDEGKKYIECMTRVVLRANFIKDYLEDKSNLEQGKVPIAIEFMSLQYRKIFELIILACLAANRKSITAESLSILNEYHPDRIRKFIRKKIKNEEFYPKPIKFETIHGYRLAKIESITSEHLSEQDLWSAWKACGDHLHTRNPYAPLLGSKQILKNFQIWWDKIQKLLFCHCVKVKEPNIFLVVDTPFYDLMKIKASVAVIELTHNK